MSNSKLLPCPFCGGVPTLRLNPENDYEIFCINTGCSMGVYIARSLQNDAIEKWNTRYHIPLPIRTAPGIKGPMQAIPAKEGETYTLLGEPPCEPQTEELISDEAVMRMIEKEGKRIMESCRQTNQNKEIEDE